MLTSFWSQPVVWVLALLGVVTYLTRIGGYLVLSRFRRIPAPVKSGLEAVPMAVITTLVVPPALSSGVAEFCAVAAAGIASLRLPPVAVILLGLAVLVALRQMGL
ncbi:MAG: AzlD domain-containing protein [Nitratireductor sp.]|nr:AzlD domain-containing protein [Nitratireductor sp.]